MVRLGRVLALACCPVAKLVPAHLEGQAYQESRVQSIYRGETSHRLSQPAIDSLTTSLPRLCTLEVRCVGLVLVVKIIRVNFSDSSPDLHVPRCIFAKRIDAAASLLFLFGVIRLYGNVCSYVHLVNISNSFNNQMLKLQQCGTVSPGICRLLWIRYHGA